MPTTSIQPPILPFALARATPIAALPWPLIVLALIMGTSPLWMARIGLYQYLAVEIAIFMIYAMGYNLLLGNSGLPSFGHGAFFGVGAYAFGLLQLRVWSNLWFDLAGAVLAAASWEAASPRSYRTGVAFTMRCSRSRSDRCSGSWQSSGIR